MKFKTVFSALFTALSLLFPPGMKAEDCSRYIYQSIGYKEGLLNTVNSIYKVPGKSIWIGTSNDLYRFDGYDMVSYLSGKYITRITSCGKGHIWVLTRSGIFRYDAEKDTYIEMEADGQRNTASARGTYKEKSGMLFGGIGKIWRYNNRTDSISTFAELPRHKTFPISDINPLQGGNLLLTGPKGSIVIDKTGKEVADSPFIMSEDIPAALTDKKGRIWIARYNKGLNVYSSKGELLEHYSMADNELTSDVVLCLAEKGSEIWAGTDGGGIAVIDYENSTINMHSHIPGVKSSLPGNSIRTLFIDPYENIWAGSVRNGIMSIRKSTMHTMSDSFLGGHLGLSNPTVLSLFQRPGSPYIYIGTDGEGINRLDQRTEEILQYRTSFGTKVASIASLDKSRLLISLYSKGLYSFDERTGKITEFDTHDRELAHQMRNMGRTVNLMNETDGNIIILGSKVYRWNRKTARPDCIEYGSAGNEDFFLPIQSKNGNCYIHDSHRIYCITPGSAKATLLTTIYPQTINSAYTDKEGIIWVASSEGLMTYSTITGQTDGPIPTNMFKSASAIVKDTKDRVWIGSRDKLFAYFPNSGIFTTFGESDGALPNEFIKKAKLVSDEGNVYMGGVQGLLCIHKSYTIERAERPSIYLAKISIDGTKVHFTDNEKVEIPTDSKMIEVVVSTEEKDFLRKKRFQWTVKTDMEQVYETELPALTLQPIPHPGECEIFVSCMTRAGNWTEPEYLVSLDIPEVWYKSLWFVLTCFGVMFLIFIGISVGIVTHIDDMNNLEKKESERRAYEDKIRFLINWGNELKTPLTLVQAPLKRVLEEMPEDEKNYPALKRIYRQSRRVRNSLNIMLDLRAMENGEVALKLKEYDFNEWISATAKDFIDEGEAQDVKISEILDPQIKTAKFDKNKCDMVLAYFLIEAIKNSSRNDIILLSTSLMNNGNIRVSVSGQSNNISDMSPENLFTGYTGDSSKRSSVAMAYAKILIELHGGTVGAYNNERGGITAWFDIPGNLDAENVVHEPRAYLNEVLGNPAMDAGPKEPDLQTVDTAKSRLLLVDDSTELLNFVKTALQSNFAEIYTATDSKNALSITMEVIPDIIVCDVNMPNGDGYEFCSTIKGSDKYGHIPVILLTEMDEDKSKQYGYKAGADGILGKPFEVETLYELIRNQLRRKADIKKRYVRVKSDDQEYTSSEEQFIIMINKTISENISNPALGVDILCKSAGVSRAVLYNKLKMITGVGANEYISKIRIEKAIFLIENTDLPFTEIADKTGFSTSSYFSTAFKQHTGQTPTQYKKLKRPKEKTQ